jgi:hypothetical protein
MIIEGDESDVRSDEIDVLYVLTKVVYCTFRRKWCIVRSDESDVLYVQTKAETLCLMTLGVQT